MTSISNPLADVDDDYGSAVLHLAWDVNRRTRERTLLCATVELLPNEVPPPLERPERHRAISRLHFVYVSRRVLTVQHGLAWFAAARQGRPVRPREDGTIPGDVEKGPFFASMPVLTEPPEPLLATSSQRIPFAADWYWNARVRHLIPQAFDVNDLWSPDEVSAATLWLRKELHFDFSEFCTRSRSAMGLGSRPSMGLTA